MPKTVARTANSGMSQRRELAIQEGNSAYLKKRAELLRTAAEVFNEQGYESTTLNDIADKFGTDRASLYYYVASKEELFQEVFQSSVQGVLEDNLKEAQRIEGLDLSAREKLSLLLQVQLKSYADNYPYVYIYISEDMGKVAFQSTPWAQDMLEKTRALASIVRQILENGAEQGEFRSDIPPALMSRAFFGMINWTHRWFNPKTGTYSAEQVAYSFSQIFFDGVAPRPGDSPA